MTTVSCGGYEMLEIKKDCKRVADSLFRSHRDSLNKYTDSICDAKHAEYLQSALDSLRPSRLEEIKKLIKK